MIEQPADQELDVLSMHATTNRNNDNPPTLTLVLDVVHSETLHTWRQSLTLTRDKWIELMQLLKFTAELEEVEWQ